MVKPLLSGPLLCQEEVTSFCKSDLQESPEAAEAAEAELDPAQPAQRAEAEIRIGPRECLETEGVDEALKLERLPPKEPKEPKDDSIMSGSS